MRVGYRKTLPKMQFITLHDDEVWIQEQRHAGTVVARCLSMFSRAVRDKTPNLSLKDIEAECEKIIAANNCIPTFKGFHGFPGAVCLSVNKELVHGIPSDYVLQEGDVVSLDLGATTPYGAIGDAAVTEIYGTPRKREHESLVTVCKNALYRAIEAVAVGKRIGCIGNAIHHSVKSSGFKLIENYGGHGISKNMAHAQPFIPNKSRSDDGVVIQKGMSFAIEPMLVIGSNKTRKLSDNWTVVTPDIGAHFEHTIFINTKDEVEIITK